MAPRIQIQLRQVSASASEATIGMHHVLVDRPGAQGGGDQGPMGGQLFLASVGGCFMSNLLAAIKTRGAQISDVRVEVAASLADSPARFVGLELQVTAHGRDREELARLVEIADRGCIMMNTLRATLNLSVLVTAAV